MASSPHKRGPRILFGQHPLIGGDVLLLLHQAEGDGTAPVGLVGEVEGIGGRRVPDEARQVGGLGQAQIGQVLVEVVAGGGRDAIGASTEPDPVEVPLQDLLFGRFLRAELVGQLLLELDGPHHLTGFTGHAVRRIAGGQLDVLLGDRRATLQAAFAGDPAFGHLIGGPGQADGIDTLVIEVALVLRGDDRLDHDFGDLVVGDDDAVLGVLGHLIGGRVGTAFEGDLAGAHVRGLVEALEAVIAEALDLAGEVPRHGQGGADDHGEHEEEPAEPPERVPAPVTGRGRAGQRPGYIPRHVESVMLHHQLSTGRAVQRLGRFSPRLRRTPAGGSTNTGGTPR